MPLLPLVTGSSSRRSVTTATSCQGRFTWLMRLAAMVEDDDDARDMVPERPRLSDEVEDRELVRERIGVSFDVAAEA